jgi:hypothetical protein
MKVGSATWRAIGKLLGLVFGSGLAPDWIVRQIFGLLAGGPSA